MPLTAIENEEGNGKYSNEFTFGRVEIEILVEIIPEVRRGVETRVKF